MPVVIVPTVLILVDPTNDDIAVFSTLLREAIVLKSVNDTYFTTPESEIKILSPL